MEKKLGLGSGIAVCVGLIVATTCLVSLGTGVGSIGRWFIIPLFGVMILNWFVAVSFGELNSLMPNVEGGTGQYLLSGMGPVASIVGNMSAYVITNMLSLTAEVTMCGIVLQELFFPQVDARIVSLAVLALFFVINWFGVDMFSKVQNVVVFLLLASMLLLGLIGLFKMGNAANVVDYAKTAPSFSDIGGVTGLCQMAALAFWLFIGVEFVIPVAKNMKNPKRDVLLSMSLGLVILFVIQSVLGNGMLNYVSMEGLANDPAGMPHMTYAERLLGNIGRYWMGGVTILAAASTVNTVYTSISKILQGMGEEGMAPKVFAKTNRHGAAYPGLILLAVPISLLILSNVAATNGITFLILTGSCFWLVGYCLIHLTVLRLRKKYPDHPRKKWLTLGGIPQILGIVGNIYMIWHIEAGETRTKIYELFFVGLILLLAYAFTWVCLVLKTKPFALVPVEVINRADTKFDELVKQEGEFEGIANTMKANG